MQAWICQFVTSWLLFQVRDKEGAKQDLQSHALAYKRRELQVGDLHFLCTCCDGAAPCHVSPPDFILPGHTIVTATCFLFAEGCHAGIGRCAASLRSCFAFMFDSKEDFQKEDDQSGTNKQTVLRNRLNWFREKPQSLDPLQKS